MKPMVTDFEYAVLAMVDSTYIEFRDFLFRDDVREFNPRRKALDSLCKRKFLKRKRATKKDLENKILRYTVTKSGLRAMVARSRYFSAYNTVHDEAALPTTAEKDDEKIIVFVNGKRSKVRSK